MKKTYIALIIILLVIALGGVSFFTYNFIKNKNETEDDIIDIRNSNIHLKDISINNFKIGDKFEPNKDYLVFDDNEFTYHYKNTFISIDNEEKIRSLGFRTTTTTDGKVKMGYKDIEVKYKDKKLENENDFKEIFNDGIKSQKDENEYKLVFTDDKLELKLIIRKKEIYN